MATEADRDFASGTNLYDVVLHMNKVVDWAEKGYIIDATEAVRVSTTLSWTDVLPMYRSKVSSYNGRVRTIPIHGDSYVLYYRKDVFDSRKLTPPESWEETRLLVRSS